MTLLRLARSVYTNLKRYERQLENSDPTVSRIIQDVKSIEKLIIRMISTRG